MTVECIKDDGYHPEMIKWIENYPVKGEPYTVCQRVHGVNGLGFLLEEITNPVMPNGVEPNFHHSRFREIKVDLDKLMAEATKKKRIEIPT
jgi:hypothetical protein